MARTGCGPGCSLPQPPRFRCLDLAFALMGTLAFLLDLGADVWVAASYLRAGHLHWGGLVLGLLALSSLATQFFSWAWLRSDAEKEGLPHLSPRTSRLLHVLQLGYLYRCLCVLKVGFHACKMDDATATQQAFAIFLSHDVSLLRLFETFLESAPQLILVIYIILRTSQAEIFQVLGICTSFLCITWALLDYHQTLRSFLRDKEKLAFLSSVLYFLWNFLLMCPRILSLALFAVTFPSYIFLHFLGIWLVMFLWVFLQGTDLMEHVTFEWLYQATAAVILYFCWFNVAEGKTRHRSTIYHAFLLLDSTILVASWFWYSFPSSWDSHVRPALLAALVCYVLGIFLKVIYYWCFHPTVKNVPLGNYDEVDSSEPGNGDAVVFRQMVIEPLINHRTYRLSQNFFAGSSAETQYQRNGTVGDMYL
ncbi:XK-related protein 8 [Python bivittatus]|uniref:XK-related protein n=1 Tax=Python bivittatus TaxID=176946 RepID=A0A9F2R394_PYTBI|nr:XK-related protein 8 [Python bivittatus]